MAKAGRLAMLSPVSVRLQLKLLDINTRHSQITVDNTQQLPAPVPIRLVVEIELTATYSDGTDFTCRTCYSDVVVMLNEDGEVGLHHGSKGRCISPGGHLITGARVIKHTLRVAFIPYDDFDSEKEKCTNKRRYEPPFYFDATLSKEDGQYSIVTERGRHPCGECEFDILPKVAKPVTVHLWQLKKKPLVNATCKLDIEIVQDPYVVEVEKTLGTERNSATYSLRGSSVSTDSARVSVSSIQVDRVGRAQSARQYFHSSTNVAIQPEEDEYDSDDCVDMSFLEAELGKHLEDMCMDANLTRSECALLKAWNKHVIRDRPLGRCQYKDSLMRFISKRDTVDHADIMTLLFMLRENGLLMADEVFEVARRSKELQGKRKHLHI
ncbi:uncharacterized protein SPPG_02024 [Spizellomyces punctatus DAOM BR117]|uniref:Polycomb protein VEFS-Box domain-containing protein n=1 Tax=Spizellomyces punctatus (strain DAOM BR117) TaxID=645134 RepID=A0A0L0HPQ0_SPIPD|nr:uncharacterized protein SPPG_02024 [Spizellomyces punctatus DAOM BR117]KND02945.1 hypothetical protein SPPG_02024 [Spizellomyces punctatus DAOM BR117]|eukprot:XP_016610984.1 hypothetical protein SPPG_02024 [Spizellomyces punctatus DAOM BR117]